MKPPHDTLRVSKLRVTKHARDRLRERVPFTSQWTDAEVDNCLVRMTEQARGRARIDGLYPLDFHGVAQVRAAVVGDYIVSVTPKPIPHPGHRMKSQQQGGGSRKTQKRRDGVRNAKRTLKKFHAQQKAERLRQEGSR